MNTVKYPCQKCNKEFDHKKYLQKHLRRKTPCDTNNNSEKKEENTEEDTEKKEENTEEDTEKKEENTEEENINKKEENINKKEENINKKEENINNKEEDTEKKEEDKDLESLSNIFNNSLSIVPFKNDNIIKIQKWFHTICNKSKIKCQVIVELLNSKPEIMKKYLLEIISISKKFPPRKNENKFIYGKLIEKSLLNAFIDIGFNCEDLDKTHLSGSEYKNDIKMLKLKYSIKAQKSRSDVRLINTLSTAKHNINMTLILCVINDKKLYIFPSVIVNQNTYIKKDAGSISYKASLFSWIDKNHPEYIYNFPSLTEEEETKLNNIQEIMIYEYLYDTFIKST